MRADVRDDYLPVLASGPPIEVPVEVLFVGEVRFLEVDPPSFDNGLAILDLSQTSETTIPRLDVPTPVHCSSFVCSLAIRGCYAFLEMLFGPAVCLKSMKCYSHHTQTDVICLLV